MPTRSDQVRARPVSLARLLDVVDVVVDHGSVSYRDITRSLGVGRNRSHELLNALVRLAFLERVNSEFNATDRLKRFVAAWDKGDLRKLVEIMREYHRFELFVAFLERCSPVRRPTSVGKGLWKVATVLLEREPDLEHAGDCFRASLDGLQSTGFPSRLRLRWREESGSVLTDPDMRDVLSNLALKVCLDLHGEGLNLTEFDTLYRWGRSIGAVYLSGGHAYYGAYEPTPEEFARMVEEEYFRRRTSGDWEEIGIVADAVCRRLRVSLPTFERRFQYFCDRPAGIVALASAVPMHRDRSSETKILLPRSTQGARFEVRSPTDGVRVAGHQFTLVRMVRRRA